MSVIQFCDRCISQNLLERYLAAVNQSDTASAHEADLALEITAQLETGVMVEPGIHTARLKKKRTRRGKKVIVKLKVKEGERNALYLMRCGVDWIGSVLCVLRG